MPQVSVINKSKTLKTYNLPHEQFCTEERCSCTRVDLPMQEKLPDGGSGVRIVPKLICMSLHLPAGEQSQPMPPELLKVREIRHDIDSRALRLVEHAERPAPVVEQPVQPSPPPPVTNEAPATEDPPPPPAPAEPSSPPERASRSKRS